MNCKAVRPRLTAYQDGELSPGEAVRVAEHLAVCDACAAREVRLGLATPAVPRLPAALRDLADARLDPAAIAAHIASAAPAPARRRWSYDRLALAAAALAAFAIGFATWWTSGEDPAEIARKESIQSAPFELPASQFRPAAYTPEGEPEIH